MKFLRSLFGYTTPELQAVIELAHTRGFMQHVVGEASYQKALARINGGKTERSAKNECSALLICENDNRYDKNAVAVKVEGKLVGYLPKEDSVEYRRELALLDGSLPNAQVRAKIVGGWRRDESEGHFGVKLNIKRPLIRKSD